MRFLLLASWLVCSVGCASRAPGPPAYPFHPSVAQPADKEKLVAIAPQLDALLRESFRAANATAMVVGIVLDGELVYARAFGVRDTQTQSPVDIDSLFRMASLTKSFTAMAILKLRDEGKVTLDAPLASYLPELTAFGATTRDAAPITLRALLTHGAGLPWDDLWGAVSFGFEEADWQAFMRAGISLAHVPDSEFEYSNVGYALLGKVIERVSGVSYHDYVTMNILRPLGMDAAVWSSSVAISAPARLTTGYRALQSQQRPEPRVSDGAFEPAGGLYLSLRDYARYMAYQLAAYPPRDAREAGPVRRSSLREMHQSHRPQREPGAEEPIVKRTPDGVELSVMNYGFAWSNRTTCNEGPIIEHGGWEPGYYSSAAFLPTHRIGIIGFSASEFVEVTTPTLDLIRNAGALPAQVEPVGHPGLDQAQRAIVSLLSRWDPALASRIIDSRSDHYQWFQRLPETLANAAREHGRCQSVGPLRHFGRLHGRFHMQCERGAIDVDLTLSPANPPRVVRIELEEQLPPSDELSRRGTQIAASIGVPDSAEPDWFAPEVDLRRVRTMFSHAAVDHGRCEIEQPIAGDGHTQASFRLQCQRGALELSFTANQSAKVTSVDLHPPRSFGAACWH